MVFIFNVLRFLIGAMVFASFNAVGLFIGVYAVVWFMYGGDDFDPWITAIDIPSMPLRYYEGVVAYYYGEEQFDASDKGQV